jgi:hypothetical protein
VVPRGDRGAESRPKRLEQPLRAPGLSGAGSRRVGGRRLPGWLVGGLGPPFRWRWKGAGRRGGSEHGRGGATGDRWAAPGRTLVPPGSRGVDPTRTDTQFRERPLGTEADDRPIRAHGPGAPSVGRQFQKFRHCAKASARTTPFGRSRLTSDLLGLRPPPVPASPTTLRRTTSPKTVSRASQRGSIGRDVAPRAD